MLSWKVQISNSPPKRAKNSTTTRNVYSRTATAGSVRSQKTLVSTQNTDEVKGWLHLLQSLTDDELKRYGEVARDQRNKELDHWWAPILSAVIASIALGYAVWLVVMGRSTLAAFCLLVVTIVLGIWPYQKAKMRSLWQKHCKAVAAEQARRKNNGV